MASIDDFHKIEMQIGKIISAELIPGADKLLRLQVDFGLKPREGGSIEGVAELPGQNTEERDVRQILSGIREFYEPETLIGKYCPFVTNLPTRTMRGFESQGMILAVKTKEGGAVLLHPEKEVPPGCLLS